MKVTESWSPNSNEDGLLVAEALIRKYQLSASAKLLMITDDTRANHCFFAIRLASGQIVTFYDGLYVGKESGLPAFFTNTRLVYVDVKWVRWWKTFCGVRAFDNEMLNSMVELLPDLQPPAVVVSRPKPQIPSPSYTRETLPNPVCDDPAIKYAFATALCRIYPSSEIKWMVDVFDDHDIGYVAEVHLAYYVGWSFLRKKTSEDLKGIEIESIGRDDLLKECALYEGIIDPLLVQMYEQVLRESDSEMRPKRA